MAVLAFLSMTLGILVGGAVAATVPQALTAVQDASPHAFSEDLNAYSSATGNSGSAFGGWGAAGVWRTTALGLIMLLGRYAIIVPLLAIAGAMIRKPKSASTSGTFPTHGLLFVTLLILTVLILGALTFFPVLALGPIAEETARMAGQSFCGNSCPEMKPPICPALMQPPSGKAGPSLIRAPCGATR
jgi:K+-transporting ATPase ATPase A chain